jgi:hypothetical protein
MTKRKQVGAGPKRVGTSTGGQSYPSRIAPGDSNPEVALSRLSLQRCRSMLGSGCELTDAQVLKLRDALYDLANVALAGGTDRIRSGTD